MEALRVGLVGYGGAGRGIHARLLREAGQHVTCVVTRSRPRQVEQDWPGATRRCRRRRAPGARRRAATSSSSRARPASTWRTCWPRSTPGCTCSSTSRWPPAADDAEGSRLAPTGGSPCSRTGVGQAEQLTLLEVLASGQLGTVHRFERRWERFRPVPQDRWKENDPDSGGLLLDLGAHLVDSAVQLFGPVAQVYAELHARTTPAVDDVFLALVHAGNGVVSHLQAAAVVGVLPGPRTRVLGDGGAYLVTSFEGEPRPSPRWTTPTRRRRRPGEPVHEGWLVRGADRSRCRRRPGDT